MPKRLAVVSLFTIAGLLFSGGCSSSPDRRAQIAANVRTLVQAAAQAYVATQGDVGTPEAQAAAAEIILGQVLKSPATARLVAMILREDPELQNPAKIAELIDQLLVEFDSFMQQPSPTPPANDAPTPTPPGDTIGGD